MKLAKVGYCGGNPEAVGGMNANWVMKLVDYEDFCGDYEEEHYNLNKNNG